MGGPTPEDMCHIDNGTHATMRAPRADGGMSHDLLLGMVLLLLQGGAAAKRGTGPDGWGSA
eukprot:2486441-Alexandrium_andersonii.AAC.1